MPMQYKKVLYGGKDGIDVGKADISSIATEAGKYLKENGMQAQGIKLPGLGDATKLVTKAIADLKKASASSNVKDLGFAPALKVVGGIDAKGNLSATVTGKMPPAKAGKPPVDYEETAVIRKDWAGLEKELSAETNVVVNLTKGNMAIVQVQLDKLFAKHSGDLAKVQADKTYKALVDKFNDGDDTINTAAANQAKKYKTTAVNTDHADFGEMTTGTVILAAHGSRVTEKGISLGTKLGKKTAEEIVDLLTGQKDKKKNLSMSFKGTVLLSGCFTAAGLKAPHIDGYDYDTFAGKVWNLLKAKGIKCKVSGLPGTAYTSEDGSKSSVKPNEQAKKDKLKKRIEAFESALKTLEPQLKTKDKKVLSVLNKQKAALLKDIISAKDKAAGTKMKDLIMNYGLDPVR